MKKKDCIVSICCELVRCIPICFFVLCNKGLCLLIICICCKRCQEHYALCQLCVKILNTKQSVQTVASKECRSISHAVCLCQDDGCLCVVDRKEYKLCTCALCLLKLCGEVCLGICGKRFFCNNFKSLILGFFYEVRLDTGRIYIGTVVDHCNLGCQLVLTDILCGCSTLVRVGKAYLKYIIIIDYIRGRCGRCQFIHAVLCGLLNNCHAGSRCNGTHQHLHTPIL